MTQRISYYTFLKLDKLAAQGDTLNFNKDSTITATQILSQQFFSWIEEKKTEVARSGKEFRSPDASDF